MTAPARPSFVTSRPVGILMVFLAAVVFGALSFDQLPVTLMPELTYPTLTVRTEYAGAAPEEVENDVSRPVEEALGVIQGLKKISSISRAGVSDVVLEFAWDTEMSDATQDVLEKLDLVFLPEEADRPLILHYDPSLDPVLELSLSGEGRRFEGESGLRRLRRLAELQIKKDLEPLKGVAAVRVRGGLEEEIHVLLDEEALRRANLPIQRVIDRLAQENINVAGGTLQEGRTEYLVRTLNEYTDLDQIRETIVTEIDGRELRIRDLGRVEMSHKEREIVTRTQGGESVQIEVFKEGDANIVALAKRVRAALGEFDPEEEEARLAEEAAAEEDGDGESAAAATTAQRGGGGPGQRASGLIEDLYRREGAKLKLVADRSLFIESSIDEVKSTAILGGLLAILVLYLFLRNAKSTAIVAVAIPISLLVTFAPLNLLGVSLNIMSLGGLALGIGMLVDSSIVVLESIYRCREEGDEQTGAAARGTQEVRGAVFASTMTSIAVFFPMVFVEGIAGQAFGDLGLAVVVSLLASTAVALFFIPMLSTYPAMGLSVSVVVGLVLAAMFVTLPEAVGQGIGIAIGATLLIGLLFTVTMALMGKLETDEHLRRMTGISRFRTLRQSLDTVRGPIRGAAWMIRRPAAGGNSLGRGARWLLWPLRAVLAPVALILGYVFWLVAGILGSVLEGILKLLLAAAVGAGTLILRWVVPAVVWLFTKIATPFVWATGRALDGLNGVYPGVIRGALRHPALVALAVLVCVAGTWQVATSMDSELLPEVHQGEFTVEVALPVGTPLEETERIVAPIEEAILEEADRIDALLLTVGFDSATSNRSDEGEHTARFKVLLDEESRSPQAEAAVIERLRGRFAEVPDLETQVVRPVLFSQKTPIEVEVHGDDLIRLREFGDRVAAQMSAMPQLADVETSLKPGAPEVQVVYDRDRLSRYGLNIQQVATLVRDKVKGNEATRFNMQDRRIPILVRLQMNDRESVEDVRAMNVNPGGDRPIRLDAVARVTLGEGPSEVRRIDARRVAVVGANIAEGSLSDATERIRATLATGMEWPADMNFYIAGQNEEWESSQRSLWIALALSIFLVYVIMAIQFESLVHPLVIMFTIPLAFVGTLVTLKVLNLSLSIVVFLGMIMLAGIVVNNAIVLVDYINTLRARGLPRDLAIVRAGGVRLRPILMTTATTVLGLLPMALGLGDGAEIRTPMAIAVISGLISSTALTLIVIPCFYRIADVAVAKILGRPEEASLDDLGGAGAGADGRDMLPGSGTVTT